MKLVNLKTQEPEELEGPAFVNALAEGSHMPEGGRALLNPNGELVISPMNEVHEKLAKFGYSIPTQVQLTELSNQQKYGEGAGNALKAGLEGVFRGATFGASDVLEPYLLDTTPEAIKERRERNPISSTTGEIGGAVGSALLLPGASPAGLLAKGATSVAESLAPAALGEGAGLAARVLNAAGQVGARAAGSAIEGAAYGLGQSVTEAALGDPDLNAEKVVANIGYGGLIGGALGGLLKAGEIAIPAGYEAAKDAVTRAKNAIIGAPGEEAGPLGKMFAKAAAKATGESAQDIEQALTTRAESVILNPAERDAFVGDLTKSVQDVHDSVSKISGELGGKVRPSETEHLLKDADLGKVFKGAEEADSMLTQAIETMKAEPDLYPKSYRRELEVIQEGFQNRVTGPDITPAKTFEALNTVKKLIDEQIPYDKMRMKAPLSPDEKRVVSLLKPLADSFRSGLEDEAMWGVAGARQASSNAAFTEYQSAEKNLRKFFWNKQLGGFDTKKFNNYVNEIKTQSGTLRTKAIERYFKAAEDVVSQGQKAAESVPFESFNPESINSLIEKSKSSVGSAQKAIMAQPGQGYGFFTSALYGNLLGGPTLSGAMEVGRAVMNPYSTINRLGNIERAAQKTSDIISRSSRALFKPVVGGLERTVGPAAGEISSRQFDKRVEEVENFNNAPQEAVDKVEWVTRDMYHVAPNLTSSVQMAAFRGSQFLNSKIPRPATPKLPFDRKFAPSRVQMIRFNRYYDTVNKPLSALTDLEKGIVYPETIETLQTVYPQLYSEMKLQISDSMANALAKDIDVPYQKRLAISAFLGEPIDSSMKPEVLTANQTAFAKKANAKDAQEQAVRTTSKGLGSLESSGRMKTALQKSSERGMS